MRLRELYEDGRIVKGVNTTVDVGVNQIPIEASKMGFTVDKDGRPPTLSKKVKGKSTNVLFNLGLSESNKQRNLTDFIKFCKEQLELTTSPSIKFVSDTEDTTFGYFDNDNKNIVVQLKGRHQMDVMRTVAHELVHYKQDKTLGRELDGRDGSVDENEANSLAGVLLRRWGQKNPTLFTETVDKNTKSSVYFTNMQEQLGEIASTSEIYVDMDGVLADFFGEWARLMKVDHFTKIDKEHEIGDALQRIRDTDDFWLRLPVLPQAKELLTLIKNIKGEYNICSTPLADDPNSEKHKRTWVEKNLSFFPPKNVYITDNKPQFAKNADGTPNILVDDFGKNVSQWEAAGGIGFKYKDHKFERTAKELQQYINEPVKESFDTQVDWEIDHDMTQGDGEAYKANIGNKEVGIQYYFEVVDAGGFPLSGVDITFEVNMTTKKTGTGDASTIFGAVVNHIKQFINQHDEIDAIEFSASKEQGFSRTRLYSAMVEKLSQGTGFINAKTISKADRSIKNADVFKLIKRSAVNDKMVGIDENFAESLDKLIVKADNGKVFDISNLPGTLQEKIDSFKDSIKKVYSKSKASVPSFKFYLNNKLIGSSESIGNVYKKVPGEDELDAIAKRMSQGQESIDEPVKENIVEWIGPVLTEAEDKDKDSIITPALEKLDKLFTKNKYEIRIVGGAVRDIALDKAPKDIDLATDATPIEMQRMFGQAQIRNKPTGIEHGTITAILDGENFEITTLRSDTNTDGRHAEVEFVRSWEEDAKRRDLTYNAMSMDFNGKIYDYHGGMDDLQNKVSKFVGDPEERIKEDYLRILRYFRFQGRLTNPKWDKEVITAIKANSNGLTQVSVERIWQEMSKILSGNNVSTILTYMEKAGVTKNIKLSARNINQVKDNEDAIISLARIVDNDSIAKTWKLSKDEHTTLITLVKNKDKELTQKAAEDLIVDGKNKTILSKLAELQGNKELAGYIRVYQAPTFPVNGNDLMAVGVNRGPEMGQVLQSLKTLWKQSNFEASKEDLLNSLGEKDANK
jgi:tRNA nucleotidyltransferase (CCA-adding enzyme)